MNFTLKKINKRLYLIPYPCVQQDKITILIFFFPLIPFQTLTINENIF